MIAIFCSDGAMQLSDIYSECHKNKWVPILVYRKKDDPTPTVILCNSEETAKRFAQRNLKRGWQLGVVYLGDEGMAFIRSKGWGVEEISWPKRMNGRSDIELGYEVVDFDTSPEVYTARL